MPLLLAPTGSGKTLAAFLWAIDRLLTEPAATAAKGGVRVLYISPLKALAYDIERNLRAPLVGVARQAASAGQDVRAPRVGMRTGDTSAQERRGLQRDPPEILVTTPESLYLMLTSQVAASLVHVHTLILDEVHALAPSKRGVHLALSLERLSLLCGGREPQRIGLSATVRPPQEAARFLGGQRPVTIVDRSQAPRLALKVVVPVDDMTAVHATAEPPRSGPVLSLAAERPAATPDIGGASQGMWAALYPTLIELLRAHAQVIIFVNSRAVCERVAQRLNDLSGEANWVRAHHGSLALARRREIEEALKSGSLRGNRRHQQPRAGHRHGRRRPGGAGGLAGLGGAWPAAHRPRRPRRGGEERRRPCCPSIPPIFSSARLWPSA